MKFPGRDAFHRVRLILLLLGAFVPLCFNARAQPLPPVMDRQFLWARPLDTNNVSGYELRWGTNRLVVNGVNSTSAVIRLEPGVQTVVLRSTPISGASLSDPVSNTVRLLRLTLERSAQASGPFGVATNWTWAETLTNASAVWRTKMEWAP